MIEIFWIASLNVVQEYATLELGLGECVRELRWKEVANIKYKVHGPTEAHLIGNVDLRLDISESISFLTEQGYRVKNYRVPQRSTKGIVFAHLEQLKKLECHRWLTLMNSTYKTNWYDWRLFTLYVCDTYGCWNVDAHFFISSEDADTVAEALTIIHNKCCRWSPRYILSDQSNIEAKSVTKSFSGMAAGEQECQVLLCVVHIMRTWMQKIHKKKPRDIMIAAMHKRTKIGCESLIQDAINHCSVPSVQNYIKRNYAKNTEKWEFFHSELKKVISSLYGLIGAVHGIVNIDCKKRSEAESAFFDFCIKKVSAYGIDDDILEEIQKFPFPFQQLIIKEACAVMNRLEKGKEQQKGAENQKIAVGELTERMRDRYWHVEEMGDAERTQSFISMLEASVDLIISRFDDNSNGKT
ncbi:hypothetical protein GLOIN_2v1775727 [Rhizophagus clarus]|uniref:MULE transposase domain-containing protein n=1 Tax=Rhizophagus clarus TaxID=94130 RepID=A0A8H3R4R0_9GLOM|nr:hypothetical protein GLOIN_2v1775727 [Rhizophagus clarus]